jgi:hypothetical protein
MKVAPIDGKIRGHGPLCDCARNIRSAEAELSAVMTAVEVRFGRTAALTVGDLWVQGLEEAASGTIMPFLDWRHLTAQAMRCLAMSGNAPDAGNAPEVCATTISRRPPRSNAVVTPANTLTAGEVR